MISFCRICLAHISLKDSKSKSLVDFHSTKKSEHKICNIAFFKVLSSCLPDLNLTIPIDSMPRICESCCTKICDLYDLKQQSLKIEKLLLQFVKYNKTNDINKPVKLLEVANLYNSIVDKKYISVGVVDFVKQLYWASLKEVPKTVQSVEANVESNITSKSDSKASQINLSPVGNNNKDAVILVVEENGNGKLNNALNEQVSIANSDKNLIGNSIVKKIRMDPIIPDKVCAETWFKLTQTNLLQNKTDVKSETNEPTSISPSRKNQVSSRIKQSNKMSNSNLIPEDVSIRIDCEIKQEAISLNIETNEQEIRPDDLLKKTSNDLMPTLRKSLRLRNVDLRAVNALGQGTSEKLPVIEPDVVLLPRQRQPVPPPLKKSGVKKRKRRRIDHVWFGINRKSNNARTRHNRLNRLRLLLRARENNSQNEPLDTTVQQNTPIENSKLEQLKQNKTSSNELKTKLQNETLSEELVASTGNKMLINEAGMINETENLNTDPKISYICEICGIKFITRNELERHLCCTTTVQCEVCNVLFLNENKWNQHKCVKTSNNITNSNNLVFLQENPIVTDKNDLLCHVDIDPIDVDLDTDSHMDSKNYIICEICDMTFLTKAELAIHVTSSHDTSAENSPCKNTEPISILQRLLQPRPSPLPAASSGRVDLQMNSIQSYLCDQCPLSFDTAEQLLSHTEQVHKPTVHKKLFQCKQCNQEFQYAHHLRRHKTTHTPRRCPICGITIMLSHNLHAHITSAHKWAAPNDASVPIIDLEQIATPLDSPLNDSGPIIGEISSSSVPIPLIIEPISATNSQPKYICMKCGDLFVLQSELELHGKSHMIDIKFECPVCRQVFPSRPAFRMHQNSTCSNKIPHHDKPINVYSNCDNEDILQKRFGNIVFTKQNDSFPLYQCRLCRKKFISQQFLMNHLRNHVTDAYKPQCQECKVVFSTEHSLKRHIALKHKTTHQE